MVRVLDRLSDKQARPVAFLILCAIASCTIAIVFGGLGVLTYSEQRKAVAGLTLQHLRPLHTTFAVAWIYLAAGAIVYYFLVSQPGERTRAFSLRLKGQLVLWGVAGAGSLVTLCYGVFSGREYIGSHWAWSVLIYVGWILFAWNFFSVVGFRLSGRPTYVYMWFTSLLLFLWAFAEGHAWHLAVVGDYPLRDMAIQWKSYGPLVGSFNLLVYGSLGYIGCRLVGDSRYAYSNTAFFLFYIGVFNSFTNFAHHTYHLPQSHVVKWISCLASLTEIVLVMKYLVDLGSRIRQRHAPTASPGVGFLMSMTTAWSCLLVGLAVLISVPPINALIHGTHFVMGHAMGMMLGIDSMALWAALLFVIQRMVPPTHRLARARAVVPLFTVVNIVIFLLVALLSVKGLFTGYLRYLGPLAQAPPKILALFPQVFMVLGILLAVSVLCVNVDWALAVTPIAFRRRSIRHAPQEVRAQMQTEFVVTASRQYGSETAAPSNGKGETRTPSPTESLAD